MQKVKLINEKRWYHSILARFFDFEFLKEEDFKRELNKKKRMIKNLRRLIKDPSYVQENFEKGYGTIERWQKEVDYMEKQLKKG